MKPTQLTLPDVSLTTMRKPELAPEYRREEGPRPRIVYWAIGNIQHAFPYETMLRGLRGSDKAECGRDGIESLMARKCNVQARERKCRFPQCEGGRCMHWHVRNCAACFDAPA